jgi:signal transduction histidine kinase
LIPYDGAGVVLLEDQDQLRVYLNRGSDCEVETVAHLPFAIQPDSLYAHLLRENESVIIHNWDEEWPHLARIGSPHARSWLAVPLTAAHQAMGFCFLEKEQTEAFTPAQMYLAEALAGQASVAIQNAWLFEQVRGGQERFQNLSRRLVEVQEGERRYIARELHDEAGQALASISVRLDLLEQHAHDPQVVTEAVAGLHAAVDDVLTGLHRMAMNLRPASLDHLGLAVSLEQYLKSFSELQRLKVNFASIGEDLGRLNPEVEINLYRIVQEALANVAMHAQATQVDVLLKLDRAAPEPRLVLLIEDNGRGFDPHEALGDCGHA